MNIQEQIDWLRSVDRYPKINTAMGDAQREVADTLEALLEVAEAAKNSNNYLRKELVKHEGWAQFDFSPEPYDLYWFYQQEKALAKIEELK